MAFWRLISAIKAGIRVFHHPVLNVSSGIWAGERFRFCYAARILQEKDFKQVCPIAKNRKEMLEMSTHCDSCPYLGSAVFQTLAEGKRKFVKFQ